MDCNVKVNGDSIKFIANSIDKLEYGSITITMEKVEHNEVNGTYSYKISQDGKVITTTENEPDEVESIYSKEKILSLMELIGFEDIPDYISERQLKKSYDFAVEYIDKNINQGSIHPVDVSVTDLGSIKTIKIIMLMYNGSESVMAFSKLPVKLVDANNKVVFLQLVEINKYVRPGRMGIFQISFSDLDAIEKELDLSNWKITFELN